MTATPNALHSQAALGPDSQRWGTNPATFEQLNLEFRFDLDAAAEHATHKCPRWFGPGSPVPDSLVIPWTGRVFLNPPYSRTTIHDWAGKVIEEAPHCEVIYVLIAGRIETRWYRRCFESEFCHEQRFGSGRESFMDPRIDFAIGQAAGFPNVGLVFRPLPRATHFPVPRLGLAHPPQE